MSDELLNFDQHRRAREENASIVRCARCGKWIAATALRCSHCGVHFQDEAQYFTHPAEQSGRSRSMGLLVVVVAIVLLAAMVAGLFWR